MAQPVWITTAGSIGNYPALFSMSFQLEAEPVLPATTITYTLLSGSLPPGITMDSTGLITGTPSLVTQLTTSSFAVRVTDNLGNIRDRTFSMQISGSAIPAFTTPPGLISSILDSTWIDLPITFSNPDSSNPVIIQVKEGELPPGLEIDILGVIRGYAKPPTVTVNRPLITTLASATSSATNEITVLSTSGFSVGRPIIFTGTVFGNIVSGQTYYIKSISSNNTITITSTQGGLVQLLGDGVGSMTVTLPSVSTGQPIIRTYSFTLEITSPLGGNTASYSITVINQNTPVNQGGPGRLPNTRIPTLLNTRPLTYNLNDSDPYYGYYSLPPVAPSTPASLGKFQSGEFFAFKMIGYDFDSNPLQYSFSGLPSFLTGDVNTGWITGTPTLATASISSYSFSVSVFKADAPQYATPYFNFVMDVQKDITGKIVWSSGNNLGTILNGNISTLFVRAISDVPLSYRITSGSLPPNLVLSTSGEIIGRVADQPTSTLLEQNSTTEYTFTVQAYSTKYTSVSSSKTFTVTVLQEFTQPTDILYIKATPPLNDRVLLDSLLNNDTIIPPEMIYRPEDQYFGKASSVIYEHAYGIYASDIQQYLDAVQRNHYWRNITLGEIKTAIAKNDAGEVIYEVVYSEIIDNLVNPKGVSISEQIYWPRFIDLGLGPWYTSSTSIKTSWEEQLGQQYYTSLTPGYARVLYPNSLSNMRNRVAQTLGQEYNSKLLPQWMTSQQENGSTLGYTAAWVICYTKPGFSQTVKNNIETLLPFTLNQINFELDRFSVDKSATYNYDSAGDPPAWDSLPSATPAPDPLDSQDFYVLFPRKTILPNKTQY